MNINEHRITTQFCTDEELQDLVRSVPLFAGLNEQGVKRLLCAASVRNMKRGETLVEDGQPASDAFIVIDGELEVSRCNGNPAVHIGIRERGDLVGELALLTNAPRNATLRAHTDARLLVIDGDHLRTWLDEHPEVTRRILSTAVSRLKSAEAHLVQHQHLAGLGTLAAGLAHELNNPASALVRAAGQLNDTVLAWERTAWKLAGSSIAPVDSDPFAQLRESLTHAPESRTDLDPLTRGDLEQQMQNWLRGKGVQNVWEVAPQLVSYGWTPGSLHSVLEAIPDHQVSDSLQWLAEGGHVFNLLHELRLSARVISDLVASVKSYSRLDEAPVQHVQIHEGIEQAMTLLRYKLRGVQVIRQYADDLPEITAYATELNQLWTNLIDNAIDATGGAGEISITTMLDDESIVVEIEDNGIGIPEEALGKLFEPFYTTKPPGQGTGLGLAISHSTVKRHRGTIEVESVPGSTRFKVRLPLEGSAH
jgi:signal transduction histidine kinase